MSKRRRVLVGEADAVKDLVGEADATALRIFEAHRRASAAAASFNPETWARAFCEWKLLAAASGGEGQWRWKSPTFDVCRAVRTRDRELASSDETVAKIVAAALAAMRENDQLSFEMSRFTARFEIENQNQKYVQLVQILGVNSLRALTAGLRGVAALQSVRLDDVAWPLTLPGDSAVDAAWEALFEACGAARVAWLRLPWLLSSMRPALCRMIRRWSTDVLGGWHFSDFDAARAYQADIAPAVALLCATQGAAGRFVERDGDGAVMWRVVHALLR